MSLKGLCFTCYIYQAAKLKFVLESRFCVVAVSFSMCIWSKVSKKYSIFSSKFVATPANSSQIKYS